MTTKQKVYEELCRQAGAVSGESLAQHFGVSRAAIWKAINALRADGCAIQGTPKGGYVLTENDVLNEGLFYDYVAKNHPEVTGITAECFKEIDSTNTYAKRLLAEPGANYHKTVIVAESQSAGRGRMGRTFYSPAKTGIYLSLIYAPDGGIPNPARLTAVAAVAVCRTVEKLFHIHAEIKWINDVFVRGKKICGILTEGITNFETGLVEAAVIGIGINIEQSTQFPKELEGVAGAIVANGAKKNIGRCALAAEVACQVLKIYEESPADAIREYKSLSFLTGKTVTVYPLVGEEKSAYRAQVLDVDDEAGLVVQTADGQKKTLRSGEVSLKSSEITHTERP